MYYHSLGNIPAKRHIQFRQPDDSLYAEELISSKGFSGVYSNLYHIYPPTRISAVGPSTDVSVKTIPEHGLRQTHLKTSGIQETGTDFLDARLILMKNADVAIGLCNPSDLDMPYYYKNGEADEILFIHEGEGILETQLGSIEFKAGDYLVIPRTIIYQLKRSSNAARMLLIESFSPVETPRRYRNELGQLLEHSPYCERDIRPPSSLLTESEEGEYRVMIKKGDHLHEYMYPQSPFDVVGWDGYLWPYAFSIHDFEPITGRIHQPPPVHQTFQAHNYVICSFVPRLFDYHPQAIPAPYNHSNIESDEVLFYAEGNFMSRKGIDRGSFTLHPGGLPHGPHPGTVEKSIGAKETHEIAVMIDTFKPLYLTELAKPYVDEDYPMSWS